MPIYEFVCRDCGERFERRIHHSLPHDEAGCACGGKGKRVWSRLAGSIVEMPGFKEGYSIALDCYIKSKRQLKDELKRCGEEYHAETGLGLEFSLRD